MGGAVASKIEAAKESGVLDLDGNQLRRFPDAIGGLTSLRTLDLRSNQLTHIPDAIGELTILQHLDLRSNQLTGLPGTIDGLTSLQVLRLNSNQLTSLPEAICELTSLQELWLYNNQLTGLPDAIGGLVSLWQLYLENNKLTLLPDTIGRMTSLEMLILRGNPLESLPDSFVDLPPCIMDHSDFLPRLDRLPCGGALRLARSTSSMQPLRDWFNSRRVVNTRVKVVIGGLTTAGKSTLVDAIIRGAPPDDEPGSTSWLQCIDDVSTSDWRADRDDGGGASFA